MASSLSDAVFKGRSVPELSKWLVSDDEGRDTWSALRASPDSSAKIVIAMRPALQECWGVKPGLLNGQGVAKTLDDLFEEVSAASGRCGGKCAAACAWRAAQQMQHRASSGRM